jgi:hypothetical protein
MVALVRFAAPNFGNDVTEGAGSITHTLTLSAPASETVTVTVRGFNFQGADVDVSDKVIQFAPG